MGITLANDLDTFVFGKYTDAGYTITNSSWIAASVLSTLATLQAYFKSVNVPEGTTKYLEVSPFVSPAIILAKILRDTDNSKTLSEGYLGKAFGFEIYESNNITKNVNAYECIARTKKAISFAEQLTETEAYKPQKRFGDAVKSLQVWGGKVVRPKEFVRLTLTPGTETAI
jgi:hypothetical protein